MRRILFIIPVCSVLAITACTLHRIDIQQGNVIEDRQVDQLGIGMSRQQVQFLLGTPAITDPFHAERWDYIYYFRPGRPEEKARRKHLTLYFEQDHLVRIERR